ncbi:MAG: PrsW family intramembrane metalloprotease, partial [Thermoanaerobaculia bacterium]|nr:PrsW family intramembrane metalloprotease [Thermoanaerobaculia bacterium]
MLRFLPGRLRHDRRLQRLVLPACTIVAASIVLALVLDVTARNAGSPAQRAARLAEAGDLESADRLYWQALASGVDLETLVAFIDNRASILQVNEMAMAVAPHAVLRIGGDDAAVRRLVSSPDLGDRDSALALFWYESRLRRDEADPKPALALADATPPARLANHLLARTAMLRDEPEEAARRYEREGLAFPGEADDDLRRALRIWRELEAWDELRARASDPRWASASGPKLRLAIAEHDRDWPTMLLWLWPSSFEGVEAWPLALAALAGVLWFLIATRLGRISESVSGRRALYAAAFALGVLSVYPTLIVITIEEVAFDFRPVGQVVPDAIYYVFGVGLREEACKLLLFLPLLPILRRRGSRVEALTCGALVGLGFAAEENLLYFQNFEASVALTRFLTANFLHMSLTALAGLAVYDASRAWNRSADILNATLPMIVLV